MEKRFVLFLVLSIGIWFGYLGLRIWLAPPPAPVAKQEEPAAGKDDKAAKKGENDQRDNKKPTPPEPPSSSEGTDTVETPKTTAPKALTPEAPARKQPNRQQLTLGSLAPNGPYRMLATFDNRGAALERVELSSPRYRDLEDKTGYLGHLHLTDAKSRGGALVHVVGPGTPAATAKPIGGAPPGGIRKGDIILAIDDQTIETAFDVELFLRKTQPEQTIEVTVERPAKNAKETDNDKAGNAKPATHRYAALLMRRPLEVIRPEQPTYTREDGAKVIKPFSPPSLLMTLQTLGTKSLKVQEEELAGIPSLRDSNWEVEAQGTDFITFSTTIEAPPQSEGSEPIPLKVVKHYSLKKVEEGSGPGYDIDLRIEVENKGGEPLSVAYRLDGPNGLPLEGWWYSVKLHPQMMKSAGARDAVLRIPNEHHILKGCSEIVSAAREATEENLSIETSLLPGTGEPSPLDYAGVDAQFFSSIVLPQPKQDDQPILFTSATAFPLEDVELLDKARVKTANVTVRLITQSETIEPSQSLVHNYRIFAGPKEPRVLEAYGAKDLIEYGWAYAAIPAKVLLVVLEFLQAYPAFGNYGIAIILLTLIVRSCMVPFSLRQARSAAMMQQIQPEMQKIKEKYANDMEKQGKAMRELYAKHNFNPFGGCLLLVFQLPVFVGLYRCLSVDIELRDASLIPGLSWASNLAGPDMLLYWKDWSFMPAIIADEAHGWLGPYFNILPLFTVALFILQQKMFTPPATDDQTRMQQQMMTYMTVFMGLMFYKVPAGLCLYFITSSLWSVIERKLIHKPQPGAPQAAAATPKPESPPAAPTSNGSPSRRQSKKQKKR